MNDLSNSSGKSAGQGGGMPWGTLANMGENAYGKITKTTPKEYSDLEEGIIYPAKGAMKGFSYFGPWGALGGGLYGLGYAFKDDLGMKNSNFVTQMLFPLGMGDGGGLKIGGKPVLDIL